MNDQRVNQALKKCSDALSNLEDEITTYVGDKKSRNSVLLTFVLAFETFWKALKTLLLHAEGIDTASPKDALRNAYQLGWLGEKDEPWLDMADDRNLVAHTYNEQQAIDIYNRVKIYYTLIQSTFNLLQTKYPHLFTDML